MNDCEVCCVFVLMLVMDVLFVMSYTIQYAISHDDVKCPYICEQLGTLCNGSVLCTCVSVLRCRDI